MRVRFTGIFFAAAVGVGLAVSTAAAEGSVPPISDPSLQPAPAAVPAPAPAPPSVPPEPAPAASTAGSGTGAVPPAGDPPPLPSLSAGKPSLPVGRLPDGEVFSLAIFMEQVCREARPPALPALLVEASVPAAGVDPAGAPDVAAVPAPCSSPFRPIPERPEVAGVLHQLTGRSRKNVQVGISRSSRYIPMMKGILEQMELPLDLISLPLVESNFSPHARSRAGAVGLWQFMERTARASGLRVDWWVDERLDPLAATRAAARHLKELYERFGDWELVLAAYNAGSGGVERAMKAHKADDFWDLVGKRRLHRETQQYVPSFYAAMMILEEPQKFGFESGPEEPAADAETVWVDSPVDLMTVARLAEADYEQVRALNPALLRGCTPPNTGRFPLRVPVGTAEKVTERLLSLSAEERLDFVRHTVGKGDTLWAIAKRYRTDVRSIQELNRFKNGKGLRVGKPIVVPVRRSQARNGSAAPPSGGGGREHVVESGDTLYAIAREAGVSVNDLVRWNGLASNGAIRPGQRLRTAPPGAQPREAATVAAPAAPAPVASAPAAAPAAPPPPVSTASADEVHVVRRGETAWSIARASGVAVNDLLRWNGLKPRSTLRPGARLRLNPATD